MNTAVNQQSDVSRVEHFSDDVPVTSVSFIQYLKETIFELSNFKFALYTGVVNKLRKRYQRSILGFAWSLLNPLMTMIVLTVVFSMLFDQNPRSYAAYLITGLLPWLFIKDGVLTAGTSIIEGEQFLKKVSVNPVYFPIVTVSTEMVNFVLSLVSLTVLGSFIGLHFNPALVVLPVVLLLTSLFVLGLGIIVSVATVYFRDLTHILSIVLSSMFYFTPIFYSLDQLPEQYRSYFLYNPFYYFVDLFRIVVFEGRFPGPVEYFVPIGLSLIAIVLGAWTLYLRNKNLIYRL